MGISQEKLQTGKKGTGWMLAKTNNLKKQTILRQSLKKL